MAKKTTVRFEDEQLLLAARHRALDEDITFQELVERAVREYLKTPPKRGKGAKS